MAETLKIHAEMEILFKINPKKELYNIIFNFNL